MQLLDLKDRKILYQLDLNARQSNTQIARKVGLSKEVTNYRIKRLEKEGYLAGYHTLINFSKLGMTSMRVYLKLIDANPEKEEELINTLVRHNKVLFVLQTEGLYDIGFALLVKNIKEFEECYTVIKEQFKPYIEAERISFHTEIHHYHRAYFLEKKHDDVPAVVIREEGLSEYDETDFKILCLLSGNARMPLLEIAEKTGIAPRTAANRIHQLEKKKIVIGYRSICNIKKINYEYYKTDFVLRDIQHLKKLIDFCHIHPNIIYAIKAIGGHDLECGIETKNHEEFEKIINALRNAFPEIRSWSQYSMKGYRKFVYFPTRISEEKQKRL